MPKAYSYIRFSTPDQLKGDSLRRQVELSEKYAAEHQLELDTSLDMRDLGVSAYDQSNIKKGALGQFLKLVETGNIEPGSVLLVENLDRLSRANILDALNIFTSILQAGISIVTLADGGFYSKESLDSNWGSLFTSIVIMMRATEESATKSKRIRASWDQKRASITEKRLTARCPYWLKPTNGEKGFEFIPERVDVVKRILQMAADGMGNSLITKRLNEEKVLPFSSKTDGWQPTYIQKLLRSPALYGEFRMHIQRDGVITPAGESVPDYYPAVISKDEWLLINSRREARTTKGGSNKGTLLSNLFSGLLFCGHCRGPMTMGAHSKKVAGKVVRERKYVGCSRARRGLGCRFITWNYLELEEDIIKFCRSVDFAAILGKGSGSGQKADEAFKLRLINGETIKANHQKISNLLSALEGGGSKTITQRIVELESQNEKLIQENAELETEINRLAVEATENAHQQDSILETLQQLKSYEGRKLHDLRIKLSAQIKRAVDKIFLYPGGEWVHPDKSQKIREDLKLAGYTDTAIAEYLSNMEAPNPSNKYMLMMFKNGEILRLSRHGVMLNMKNYSHDEYAELRSITLDDKDVKQKP